MHGYVYSHTQSYTSLFSSAGAFRGGVQMHKPAGMGVTGVVRPWKDVGVGLSSTSLTW